MDAEKLRQLRNAVATANAMLEVAAQLLEEDSDGSVSGLHGVDHVGANAERREDPDRRPGDTSRGGGQVARLVVGRSDAEAGASRGDVAGRGAGRPPSGLPAAASHLIEGARYRVVGGVHDTSEGVLIPGSIDESGFGKVFADIAARDGGVKTCRAEDLVRVDG